MSYPTLPQQLLDPEEWAAFVATYKKIGPAFRRLSMLIQRVHGHYGDESWALFISDEGLSMASVEEDNEIVASGGHVTPRDLQYPAEAEMRLLKAIEDAEAKKRQQYDEQRRRSELANIPGAVLDNMRAIADNSNDPDARARAKLALEQLGFS